MATPNNERSKLIRVQGPALPVVRLISESDPTASVSELIRVQGPALPVVRLMAEPVEPATLEATHPAGTPQGEREFGTLSAFVGKMNEAEQLYNRPGVRIDAERSGVRDGKVVIVLAPNDPTDAIETCKRVADYLFAAIRTIPGATVRVMVEGQPDKPVYEMAS